ncbi:DRC1 protein, partial [Campylorhamphus procurvoides]|nr:DRC1 protein [Campylorhamphus procurvoides]
QSLESDRERITGQHKEMQKRMRHFAVSGAEKFRRVWLVNEEEAKGLMRKALEADRIIHVQQLGMPWEEPLHWFLDNVGPLGERPEKRAAIQVAGEVMKVPGKLAKDFWGVFHGSAGILGKSLAIPTWNHPGVPS